MRTKITFQPSGKVVSMNKGENILRVALSNRVFISNRCGGKGSCTACKVQLTSKNAFTSSLSPQEKRMLREEEAANGFRLACQTRVYAPCEVAIPAGRHHT